MAEEQLPLICKIDPYEFDAPHLYYGNIGQFKSIPLHEVLVSFNNDMDAELFRKWWEIRGKVDFESYFDESTDEYGDLLDNEFEI